MARRRRGPGSRSRRGFVANTRAPRSAYAIKPGSSIGGKGRAKYPVDTLAHARNALSRVAQHGSPAEKRAVYAAVRRRHPALARRSSVLNRGRSTRHATRRRGTRRRTRRRTRSRR